MNKQIPSPVNRGMLTIEILVALVVIMLAVIYGYPRYTNYMQEMEWGVEASNMTAVGSAAKSYIRDNRDALVSQVSGGAPVTVTGAQLQQAGYLPTGFSLRNTAAQTYLVGIARDPKFNQKLVAFVLTTGGQEIAYKGLRYISQKVDGSGGYVWPDNMATGAFAGWELNLNSYGLSAAKGRLATWLSSEVLGTDLQESDRLYRYQVSGRPDLNRMHTAIDMGSNDLNNAKAVNGETGNFSNTVTAENDVKSKSGWLITGTGKGWLNEAHGGGLYMDDNDWIKSVNGKGIYTSGQLKGGTVRSDGRIAGGEYLQLDGIATEGAVCSPDRLIGFNASGNVLSCQSSRWAIVGEATGSYASLGSYISTYSGVNSGNKNIVIYANGGESTVNREIREGDNCKNTWALAGYVGGTYVTGAQTANSNWSKSGAINFIVPPGAAYQVTSNPLPSYGCSPGSFSLMVYR